LTKNNGFTVRRLRAANILTVAKTYRLGCRTSN